MAKNGNTLRLIEVMEKAARVDENVSREYGEGIVNLARDMGIPEDDIVDALCGDLDGPVLYYP